MRDVDELYKGFVWAPNDLFAGNSSGLREGKQICAGRDRALVQVLVAGPQRLKSGPSVALSSLAAS